MTETKRLYLLILIMTSVSLFVGGIAIVVLYRASIDEQRGRLMESAQSQARLIEAVARFDARYSADYPAGPAAATLSQIVDAHEQYEAVGATGEFTLAKRAGERIIFLLSHRHHDLEDPKPVAWDAELAEPMRRALSGKSGTVITLDYRGETVLAAHEPVAELDLGIVAKIDLAEVRAPFVKAGLLGFISAVVVVVLASWLFFRISNPMITRFQEEHAGLDAILETAVDGIITIDLQGIVESFNSAAEQMFGHVAEDVIGRNVTMLMPAPYHDEHDGYLANYLQTGHKKIIGIGREVVGLCKDGSQFPMDLAVSEVRVGGRRFFTGIVRDITQRKQAEQELAKLNEELEERVEQRTKELRDAQDQLVRRERLAMLGQLSGSMAHEIRNPLAVIKNAVYYLRETGNQFDEESRQCLHEIETEVESANHIVTELLDYTREPKHDAKQFPLGEAVERALKTTEIPDSIHFEQATGNGALDVSADRGQVERIVGNLLRNAVQAMPDGGSLAVSCDARDGEATVTVKDTGVGIAEEDVPQVFEALFTRKAKGIGLGLAISKRYAELNHGRLEVQSTLGEGATFRVILPLASENEEEEEL